ncbi:MAG: hypothetical protein ABIF10_07590 [Candidatus Woesearchaeota archaeon]
MKTAVIVLAMLVLAGCAADSPEQALPPSRVNSDLVVVEPVPSQPEERASCDMSLQAHQIKKVKTSLSESGPTVTDDCYNFRVFPLDESGSNIIPAEASVTVFVYSSMEDNPLSREYLLFTRSYYIKREEVLKDCGTKPLAIPFAAIKNSDKHRYVNVPNYGIINVQYTRTGSEDLFEEIYNGAEHDYYLIT